MQDCLGVISMYDPVMVELTRITETLYEIPKTGKMNVEGRIYANDALLDTQNNMEAIKQVQNVACLPGIVKYSIAMPDFHWGYGFPIGGVAAFDPDDGVISPGGVGFDINCGVRLIATNIIHTDIKPILEKITNELFKSVPAGVGSEEGIKKLSPSEFKLVAEKGAVWAVENGYGSDSDLAFIEENGKLDGADFSSVSDDAVKRGRGQLGTLGSGNHFLEIQVVDKVYNKPSADRLGLTEGSVAYSIHCGSRGFGHQICDDYLKTMLRASQKYNIHLPDPQLCCAPLKSPEAKSYLSAMKCAANFAWANRQVIMWLADKVFQRVIGKDFRRRLIYDVCHNIAKFERHMVDGAERQLCVHRKGATRALPPGHPLTPEPYKDIGQPVLIPGDMGRHSYVLVGTSKAQEDTFCSSAHGAGRVRSRAQMKRLARGKDLYKQLRDKYGVIVRAHGFMSVAEEMPEAYKDAGIVADVTEQAGISKKVARLKSIACIKG